MEKSETKLKAKLQIKPVFKSLFSLESVLFCDKLATALKGSAKRYKGERVQGDRARVCRVTLKFAAVARVLDTFHYTRGTHVIRFTVGYLDRHSTCDIVNCIFDDMQSYACKLQEDLCFTIQDVASDFDHFIPKGHKILK